MSDLREEFRAILRVYRGWTSEKLAKGHEDSHVEQLIQLFQDQLTELKGRLPKYFPSCAEYGEGPTRCNECFNCKVRNNGDFNEGYERGMEDAGALIDKAIADSKGEST